MGRRRTVTPSNISFSPVEVKTLDAHLAAIICEGLKTYYSSMPEDYRPPSVNVKQAATWRVMVQHMIFAFEYRDKTRKDFETEADWCLCKVKRKTGWKLFKKHFHNLNY